MIGYDFDDDGYVCGGDDDDDYDDYNDDKVMIMIR